MVSAAKKIKKSTSKYLPKKLDALVKSPKRHLYVIPMKMGIQCFQIVAHPLDSCFRRNDYFLRDCQS